MPQGTLGSMVPYVRHVAKYGFKYFTHAFCASCGVEEGDGRKFAMTSGKAIQLIMSPKQQSH